MRSVIIVLFASLLLTGCNRADKTTYQWTLPSSATPPLSPDGSAITAASVELGRHLFYDRRLSVNQTTACASCHQQGLGFAEKRSRSIGATGQELARNASALINVGYQQSLTWAHDGLVLPEQQILLPLFNEDPIEMGVTGHQQEILTRFDTPEYQRLFQNAYGKATPSWDGIVSALSMFVRTLVSFSSPFDRYAYQQDDDALTQQQVNGLNLFFSERLECFHCHGGVNFSQSSLHTSASVVRPFHHNGLHDPSDTGLYAITGKQEDKGKFRAPTLRNIAVTGPYMHAGQFDTLEQVIEFYAEGGRGEGKTHFNKSNFVNGFDITDEEKAALVAFLHSLTDDQFLQNPAHSNPFLR